MFSAPGFSVKSALFFLLMCSMNKFAYFGPEPLVNLFCYESFSKTSVGGLWKQIQQLFNHCFFSKCLNKFLTVRFSIWFLHSNNITSVQNN